MSKTTYQCELPRDVVSITRTKVKPHKQSWILLAARDNDCDISVVEVDPDGTCILSSGDLRVPYDRLWRAMGENAWARVSNWALTFRSGYVLRQTQWLAGLESGAIQLERQLKLAGKQAGRGSTVLSPDMTDLDLRVGNRKIKLLDWNNFGVDPTQYVKSLNELTAENCLQIFSDWIKAQTKVGLSASRTSAPQIGWTKLRQSLSGSNIFTSLDPRVRSLERRCYYGGRCEPFRLGDVNERCYLLDVRACYASMCMAIDVPVQPMRYWPNGFDICEELNPSYICVAAECVVNVDRPIFPVRHQGRVIYPTGRFFTALCGAEFSRAVKGGYVERVARACSYMAAPELKSYAEWYVQSRDAISKNSLNKVVGSLKATFNSSLGFFARQGREWCEWEPAGSPPWWFGKTADPEDHSRVVGAHVLDRESELLRIGSEPRNCSPIVHGAICAKARSVLYAILELAGARNVLYCDTDGLIVTQGGYDNLLSEPYVCGPGYGQLSVRAQASSCTINGPKNYKIGDKVVCAGLTADRHSSWTKKNVLETTTGTVDLLGKVTPYVMACNDVGDDTANWENVL